MLWLKKWLLKRRRQRRDKVLPAENLDAPEARDLGVSVTRIRLPSGKEVVIVKRVTESSSPRIGDSSVEDQ